MSTLDDTPPSDSLSGFYGWTDTLKGVYYGPGAVTTALPQLLDRLGAKKALVVTGRTLYQKTDVVKRVESILKERDAYGATFYEIGEHTPIAGIRAGIKIFKEQGCDIIVAQETGGAAKPQIAIPTTLSAAEYSIGAGFTNDEGEKVAVSSQDLAPAGIILDGELTLPTPERLWLSTGIRSLDHAVENLYRPGVSYPVKQLMYAALKDLFHYLPLSKKEPANVEYRQRLQIASWMSLWPMKLAKYSALGISHSLGHKLGARFSIPHGITSCLTLAPTVVMKAEVGSEDDKKWLADALFYLKESSTGSLEGDVLKLAQLIKSLVVDLGLESNLATFNVSRDALESVAVGALGTQNQNYEVTRVVQLLESIM
ncbi:hypothetical protein NMY22_g16495 [Coprinellus aureogranulatus]|nr:hypothetical protein NMY22_g16495 [Coprinellus aureogranulatus]